MNTNSDNSNYVTIPSVVHNTINTMEVHAMNSEIGMTQSKVISGDGTKMVSTVNNKIDLVCPNTFGTNKKEVETNTKSQSIPEEYLCRYTDSEDSIKNPPVLMKITGRDFFASRVSMLEKEKEDLE